MPQPKDNAVSDQLRTRLQFYFSDPPFIEVVKFAILSPFSPKSSSLTGERSEFELSPQRKVLIGVCVLGLAFAAWNFYGMFFGESTNDVVDSSPATPEAAKQTVTERNRAMQQRAKEMQQEGEQE